MLTIEEIKKLPFVFIVGRGRSGTTLLQTILDASPNIMLPLESPLIIYLKKKYFHIINWNSELIDEFIKDLYREIKFTYFWNVNAIILRKQISSYPLSELTFPILCKIIYLNFSSPFKKENILLLGDKNPIYSIFINELIEVFPDAKFIHLIRDYRDNIVSNRETFGQKNIALLAQGWKMYNVIIDKLKQKNARQFYTLRYEDLTISPEKYVAEICAFLSITFHPEMLEFYKTTSLAYNGNENKVLTDVIKHIQPNILKPINDTKANNWKTQLTKNEIELVDYIAGDYSKRYNYLPETPNYTFRHFFILNQAKIRFNIDYWVTKLYYKTPFWMRNMSKKISQKLYDWFGYLNAYNRDSVIKNKN